MIQLSHIFEDIVSVENLLLAWQEFLRGRRSKKDVQEFQFRLMDNILSLHADLVNGTYRHGGYHAFRIHDPKPRLIHKATVRDRLLHHAIYRVLYPYFDRRFVADSFSCRNAKGMHKAINRFRDFSYIVSKNHTTTCWVLKCDIRKFFHSIDQGILGDILKQCIDDAKLLKLLQEVIGSFNSGRPSTGLPLGNLTSQLFCNIYMNEFDQFTKHGLKAEHYIRYADDFVFLSHDRQELESLIPIISSFLQENLKLQLHPDKVFIKTLASGVDFLGWVHFPDHRVLRTTTKKRMIKRLKANNSLATHNSYLGLLSHGNTKKLKATILAIDMAL